MPQTAKTTWTAVEARKFLDSARQDRFFAAFALAVGTGLRRGEILGLQRSDVRLDEGVAQIVRQVKAVEGKVVVSEPKNRRPKMVELPPGLVSILRVHLSHLGRKPGSVTIWLFPDANGGPMHPRNFIARHYEAVVARAGVRRIRFHDLRHTFATISLDQGVPLKIISDALGHSSIRITADTYLHPDRVARKRAAQAMDWLYAGSRPKGTRGQKKARKP